MISCLMVTQPSRLALAAQAMADFAAQTHAERELVVVHDGGAACGEALAAAAARLPGAAVRVVAADPGQPLGSLRNRALDAAAGAVVCQWDDDDRYHPERLALQWRALCAEQAEACFLVDQLHWFPGERLLYWDDWDAEPYPFNLVQGTLLAAKAALPAYPPLARGEDTALLGALLCSGARIARLRDAGWCYTYVFHGGNAWDHGHHAAISRAKRLGSARLLQREALLRRRLAEYCPPFLPATMPHAAGVLAFAAPAGRAVHR